MAPLAQGMDKKSPLTLFYDSLAVSFRCILYNNATKIYIIYNNTKKTA